MEDMVTALVSAGFDPDWAASRDLPSFQAIHASVQRRRAHEALEQAEVQAVAIAECFVGKKVKERPLARLRQALEPLLRARGGRAPTAAPERKQATAQDFMKAVGRGR